MSNSCPATRRKQGRNAFISNTDPKAIQPYQTDSWEFEFYYPDWLEGWKEAEREFIMEEKETKKEYSLFNELSYSCPWNDMGICLVTKFLCVKENCGLWFFKVN